MFGKSKGVSPSQELEVTSKVKQLEGAVTLALEKLAIKSYAKVLSEQEKAKDLVLSRMDEIQIDTSATEGRRKLRADNLYELMFDQYGQVKTNIGKKAVVRSECLELLETGGKAVGFESLSSTKEAATYEALRFNKSLRLVNTIPHF